MGYSVLLVREMRGEEERKKGKRRKAREREGRRDRVKQWSHSPHKKVVY